MSNLDKYDKQKFQKLNVETEIFHLIVKDKISNYKICRFHNCTKTAKIWIAWTQCRTSFFKFNWGENRIWKKELQVDVKGRHISENINMHIFVVMQLNALTVYVCWLFHWFVQFFCIISSN